MSEEVLADAMRELASAIHELAQSMKQNDTLPQDEEYHCSNCGSPRWEPGGMALSYRKCMDCGTVGESIDAN